jgi:hypothetical protein
VTKKLDSFYKPRESLYNVDIKSIAALKKTLPATIAGGGKQGDSPSRHPDQATNVEILPDREVVSIVFFT